MKQYVSWLGYKPACRHACNTYTAAVHLEPSFLVSPSCINVPAFVFQPRHCLCMLQSPPSHHQRCCRCAAGGHCQKGWAAGVSDCSKDLLELPVTLAAGHQSFSSCCLSHMLLGATRSARGGLWELLFTSCCKIRLYALASWVTEPTHIDLPLSIKSTSQCCQVWCFNASGEEWRAQKLLGHVRP